MVDRRFVYIMQRTESDQAIILTSRKMLNAKRVESLLHELFGDARFEMVEGKEVGWFKNHIKIGISKNPRTRRNQVSKNIFKSGRTEWFSLSDTELAVLQSWLWWYSIREKVIFFITFLLISILGIIWMTRESI